MVWGLFPVEPVSGEDKYYIFAKGTYKVGRKGCDVTISNDKGVSRVHAEILVDAMQCLDGPGNKSSNVTTSVRVRDCSKYGTFITAKDKSKKKAHECPGKEALLEDGDLISFGTGNATYRFCYFPLKFYVSKLKASKVTRSIKEKVSLVGASISSKWTEECTHAIVDQYMPFNEVLVDAIVAEKPLVLHNWLEFFAENKISTEIPSCSVHIPTLIVDGASVAVADPKTRQCCLKGYTFLLETSETYKYGSKLQLLLEVGGAKADSREASGSSCKELKEGQNNRIVQVIPSGSADKSLNQSPFLKINEMDIVRAVISGYLDPSVLVTPSAVISPSCSTDETVVADSDAETESAASDQPAAATTGNLETEHPVEDERPGDHAALSIEDNPLKNFMECYIRTVVSGEVGNEPADSKGETSVTDVAALARGKGTGLGDYSDIVQVERSEEAVASLLEDGQAANFVYRSDRTVLREKIENDLESRNSDVLYSQNLVVRDANTQTITGSTGDNNVVNFKRFRKAAIDSGNSFNNLVPFAKHAYMDSDYENKEVIQSVKEEKKRKQMEAVAEDLFNNEKGRRRGAAGSIRRLIMP